MTPLWTRSVSYTHLDVYKRQLPLESNVLFMTVMATKMPFVGRG